MGLLDGLQHLIASFFEILRGILSTILSAFQSVFNLFQSLLSSVFDLMSSAVGFILGNIVIIGLLVAAYVGYSAYRQKNQGGGITGGKKRA